MQAGLELWLMRHGETVAPPGHYHGISDVGLNPRGLWQAECVRQRLADMHFDAVYTSPLSRCRDSARIIAPNYEAVVCDELREMDFGRWEGISVREAQQDVDAWQTWGSEQAAPQGESLAVLHERVTGAVQGIMDRHLAGRVLLVTHGGPIRALGAWACGLDAQSAWHFACDTGSLHCIRVSEGYGVIARWNEVPG